MKALIYIGSFIAALVISLLGVFVLLAVVIAFLSFITWSLPLASPFTWSIFRILFAIAFLIALCWSFSKENKQFVEDTLKNEFNRMDS